MSDMALTEYYDFVRHATFTERTAAKNAVRATVLKRFPEFSGKPELCSNQFGESKLNEFKEKGIAAFGQYITESERADILRYLAARPVYNAHIAGCSDFNPRWIGNAEDPAEAYQFGSYAEDVIAQMPHVTKMALNPAVLNFLKGYFGVPPLLLDCHLWWAFPKPGRFGPVAYAGQGFHRDFRSLQDIQFFTCLVDMPGDDGAHEYFAGTHDDQVFVKQLPRHAGLKNLSKEEALRLVFFPPGDGYGTQPGNEAWDAKWTEVLGNSLIRVPIRAGHCFMIDTMGLHRGVPPKLARRLIFSARYSTQGIEDIAEKRIPVAGSAAEHLTERSLTLSAFKTKLGNALGPEWTADVSRKAPNDAGLQEFNVEARLAALEHSLNQRTQRLASVEIATKKQ